MNYFPFREVGERVSAKDAARLYGAAFNSRGLTLCPFHNDHNASMSFKGGRFRCFACGEHGDSIDYTSLLFGIGRIEAAKKLNADFNLGILEPATEEERERTRRQMEIADENKRIESWRTSALAKLSEIMRIANLAKKQDGGSFTDLQAKTIKNYASGFAGSAGICIFF